MTNVVRIDRRSVEDEVVPATSLFALRIISALDPEEFADAVSEELGWPVPILVYLEWERDEGTVPPSQVLRAARDVARRNPIGSKSGMSRRRFLGGVVGLSVFAAGGSVATNSGMSALGATDGRTWRLSGEAATDIETLVGSYRRAYAGGSTAPELLAGATGLTHVLIALGRDGRWSAGQERFASLVGQAALLVGLLHLMGRQDLAAAKAHYDLALRSAREANDHDLLSYVLGSLAFQANLARRPSDAGTIVDAAWRFASRRASPRTQAWLAALASELHARAGHEARSRRLLDKAHAALAETRLTPTWKGAGWFDEAKLLSYDGTVMLLLGRHREAEAALRLSLRRLDPTRLKHRCTATADLATVLALRGEIDESSVLATEALSFARAIDHRESVDRVRGVNFRLQRWRAHPGVRQLSERLEAAQPA